MRPRGMVLLGLLAAANCGGSAAVPAHVEISGMTPEAGAAAAAHAVCTHESQCGGYGIACMSGGTAGGSGSDASVQATTCTAQFEPIVYDDCHRQASADIAKLLSCGSITPADVDTLETCFDMLDAQKCLTQAEADAQARASEVGGAPTRPEMPAACALLAHPPTGC